MESLGHDEEQLKRVAMAALATYFLTDREAIRSGFKAALARLERDLWPPLEVGQRYRLQNNFAVSRDGVSEPRNFPTGTIVKVTAIPNAHDGTAALSNAGDF